MLFFALRSTVPAPAFADSEPEKLMPEPVDAKITLPEVAAILPPILDVSAPLASASKLPVAVAFVPTKLSTLELLRKMPVEALAFTLAADDTLNRPAPVPVPIEPRVDNRFNVLAEKLVDAASTRLPLPLTEMVPLPALALNEPVSDTPEPVELRTMLPALAVIDDPLPLLKAPLD